ncbi:S-adenosyl-L-methionine-dependent methyltransferase [Phycomyces nitens]|nr:S-adenosyl-L-methionine-dependent methyltransferase [Phycomyces nitens]
MSAISEKDNDAINDLRSLDASQRIESSQIDGRRYVNQPKATYVLPFDDDESDRLIVMHFLLKHAFEGNCMAPVTSVLQMGYLEKQRPSVLDIGCGPGTWVLEMATEYPNAGKCNFYGIDLCPMFPTAIKPTNANFQQHDIFKGPLPFKDNSFDFIYMRTMLICMTKDNISHILTEMSRILKPGGYFEILDVEYRIQRPGPISETLINQTRKESLK